MIGVENSPLKMLVSSIVSLEHILADEFIAALHNHSDRVFTAIIVLCLIDIRKDSLPYLVLDVGIPLRRDLMEVEV